MLQLVLHNLAAFEATIDAILHWTRMGKVNNIRALNSPPGQRQKGLSHILGFLLTT